VDDDIQADIRSGCLSVIISVRVLLHILVRISFQILAPILDQISLILYGTRILSVGPFEKYTFPLLDGVFTTKLLFPAEDGGQQQGAESICTVITYDFGIHFCPRVTQVKLLKCGIGGYLIWRFQFWGRKRPETMLSVYFISSHLVG
jgi:hypothetical protein